MYNKTIGDLLYYYRNQKKISEEELCSGICSVSTYSRYESDETTTDKFTYGYFFERMGVDFDTINYLSSPSEGKIENERNKIYCCLKEKNYEGTKALLEEYVKKHGKKKIHKQYAMLVKGWLSELKGDKEKAQVSYAAGIACTNIDIHNINKLYSSIECELLLCYIRCTHNTDYLSKLLTFLQGKDEYDCIRAHFQTKASLQYIKGLETTFTRQNYLYLKENNISARKYVDFLYSLGTDMVAMKPVISFDGGEEYSLENENESKLFEFIDEMHSEILRRNNNLYSSNIINNILNQKYKDYYCSAGTNSFSVSTSGDIYPCFMFDGKRQFKMGNVNEKTDDNKFTATKDKIQSLSKTTNGNCKDCWANKLCDSTCAGCIGSFELYNQDIKKPIDFNCKVGKTMIERSVVEMIETIKNFQSASCEA